MLGYVHLTAGRPVLERRAAAGMTYWALEGDLDGGLFPGRRLRRWIGRLERCGVSHAALPPGREGDFAPLRPVLPDGLRLALLPQLLDALAPAGDTALLLADCADSRALLAAQVLARRFRRLRLETGAGQEALERAAAAAAGTYHRRRPRRRHRDLRPAAPGGPAPVSDSRLRPAPGGTVRLAGPVPGPAAGGASVPAAPGLPPAGDLRQIRGNP